LAKTSDEEQTKTTRTKRKQEGDARNEPGTGDGAKELEKKREPRPEKKEKEEKPREQEKEKRPEQRQTGKERSPIIAKPPAERKQGTTTMEEITIELAESGKANFCYSDSNNYDDVFHIGLGEVLCKSDPKMVYCGLFEQGEKIRAIVYAGDEISKEKSAGDIVKSISQILGGAGGGSAKFAQGGGTDKSKKEDAIKNAKSMIIE
jgi:Alanyl-tRNA synthetase